MAEKSGKSRQGDRLKIVIIVGIAVVIVMLAVVIVLLVKGKGAEKTVKRNVVINADNAERVIEELESQEYVAPGYYTTTMSTTWHFLKGGAVSEDAYVENVEANTNDVYFDVFLADDESTPILESPVIPRGARLDGIALDKVLDAGTYDCVMVYHLVDEEQNSISTLRIGFTIVVEQ